MKSLPAPSNLALPTGHVPTAVAFLSRYRAGSHTQRAMLDGLRVIGAMLLGGAKPLSKEAAIKVPWDSMRLEHAQAVRARLVAKFKPATVNLRLEALKGVLRQSWRMKRLDVDAFQRIVDVLPGEKIDVDAPVGRVLTPAEVGKLLGVSNERDQLVIILGYACGLRRSEIAGLSLDSFDPESRALTVKGKGSKTRQVFLPTWAVTYWTGWIAKRKGKTAALFDAHHHTTIARAAQRAMERAGLARFSMHDLRRTFITLLLDGGVDLLTAQRLAGHSQPTTTRRYDRRGDATKKAAVEVVPRPE